MNRQTKESKKGDIYMESKKVLKSFRNKISFFTSSITVLHTTNGFCTKDNTPAA